MEARNFALRHERTAGFGNYAHESLATKWRKTAAVPRLDRSGETRPSAGERAGPLRAFAKAEFGVEELQGGISYYSEKQKQHPYSISDEQLRPYFPKTKP